MVDAVDNKWIATNNGIWVLNPDGSELLLHITAETYPLISNVVKSLAQNKNTGTVYAGTDNGMSEMSTTAILPNSTYDIVCSPQPFDPSRDNTLIIDGLAESSQVRILTMNGELVKSIETASRSITWDGTDDNGNLVGSGVYVVSASSSTTKVTGVGKIALIRRK
jgi:flagellar hook assembly protein FlgD